MLFINIKLKFETGMSGFHQLIITISKVKPEKLWPRIINYKDYTNLENKAFNNKLKVSLKNIDMNNSSFIELKDTIIPLQPFVKKRQFFNENNQWLNNIIYH